MIPVHVGQTYRSLEDKSLWVVEQMNLSTLRILIRASDNPSVSYDIKLETFYEFFEMVSA